MKNKLARLSLIFNFTFFILHSYAALGAYVQSVPGDVADSRQNFPLRVARGEIVDLSIDFFNDGEPLDITGADVTLHTRTNGMDAAESWQTVGTATNNSALFVLDVDAVLPLAAGQWSCVASRDGRTLARLGGPAYVRGTAAAQSAALPQNALAGYATTNYVADAIAAIDVDETDPVFAEWADANTNQNGIVALAEGAMTANSADYASSAGSAYEAQTADTATYAATAAFATNAAYADTAANAWDADVAETARGLIFDSSTIRGNDIIQMDAAVAQAATNHTDSATALAPSYSGGTPTFSDWTFSDVVPEGAIVDQPSYEDGLNWWIVPLNVTAVDISFVIAQGSENALSLQFDEVIEGKRIAFTATRTITNLTSYRLGPPSGPNADKLLQPHGDYPTPSGVTNIVRDLSLGGIWDEQIQVWWTPRMRNGSLTYEATTNVNLNAEN